MCYTHQARYKYVKRYTVGMAYKGRTAVVGVGDKYFSLWVDRKFEHV